MLTFGCNPSLQNQYAGQRGELEPEPFQAATSSTSGVTTQAKSARENPKGFQRLSSRPQGALRRRLWNLPKTLMITAGWTGLEPAASGVTGGRRGFLVIQPETKRKDFSGFRARSMGSVPARIARICKIVDAQ
jgi:hypothetical protein